MSDGFRVITIILFTVSAVASVVAGVLLWISYTVSTAAPEFLSGAMIAICVAVIPYTFARSVASVGK